MSRRSRRRKGTGKGPWLGKALIVFGVIIVVAIGVGYIGIRSYLHGDGFRKFLSAQVSSAARVDGNFSRFSWDGTAVSTESFEATGKGVISEINAERIGTEIGLGGIGRGVWEVRSTRINRLDLSLNLVPTDQPAVAAPIVLPQTRASKKQPGWVPKDVELESLEIGDLGIQLITKKGLATAKNMSVHVEPQKGKNAYKAEITGGTVNLPMSIVPPLNIQSIEAIYRDGSIFLTDAQITAWKSGHIVASGESNFVQKTHAYDGNMDGVRCDEVLSENWARRLIGDLSSSFKFTKTGDNQVISGDLKITNGTLTALPMFDALAAYADTRRFRVLQLSDARAKWQVANGEILLTDIVMGSEGLIRLEGNLKIIGENIDGNLQLGLVPGTLSKIPGAETDVFQPGRFGLLWAPIRVTGTLSDPEEDLTNRLIEAAGMRMFENLPETGEKVFKFTRNALGESPTNVIDKGIKVIEKGEEVIKGAEGLFKGILDK